MPNNNDNNNNNLPSMSVLSQMIQTQMQNKGLDQTRVQSLLNESDNNKSLNYQILYKLLESAVEEFILINNGNPLADDFRNRVVNKMSDVVNMLMGNQPPNNS
jgi:hypothetical protein|tara:strand:- start:213 stop:521 length:309 start_codon:yes stop_codon:yes gene_type:complete